MCKHVDIRANDRPRAITELYTVGDHACMPGRVAAFSYTKLRESRDFDLSSLFMLDLHKVTTYFV